MSQTPPAPRIFVIPAASANTAVVFRRGPSAWWHLLQWDTLRDTFEPGAWFKGSIYPKKCDLSPDGKLLLCFVLQGQKSRSSYSNAWSAVSRSPWLAALGLWPIGTTYGGGGRFVNDCSIVLRARCGTPHPDHLGEGLHVEFGSADLHASSNEVAGCDWSGRDHAGELIFAKGGCVFRRLGNGVDRELIDLTGLVPNPQPPPSTASRKIDARVNRLDA